MSFRSRVAALADEYPDLIPHLAAAMSGGCCRVPTDAEVRSKLTRLAFEHPEFRATLLPLLKEAEAPRCRPDRTRRSSRSR